MVPPNSPLNLSLEHRAVQPVELLIQYGLQALAAAERGNAPGDLAALGDAACRTVLIVRA